MTVMVKQRCKSDCAPCCLAMLTGRTLDDVIEIIGDAYSAEQGLRHTHTALKRLGYDGEDFIDLSRPFCITADYFIRYTWRRRALISVPSLNIPNGWHMVYTDGVNLFDPCTLKTYEHWRQLKPDELILFDEPKLWPK